MKANQKSTTTVAKTAPWNVNRVRLKVALAHTAGVKGSVFMEKPRTSSLGSMSRA